MDNSLTIALAADSNYFSGLVGTLSGILRRNTTEFLKTVILDCGISDQEWTIFSDNFTDLYPKLSIRRIKISPDRLEVFVPSGKKLRLNNSAYARLLLPELLPDLDRILYLDCDLYVDTDLNTLFYCPLEGKPVAAILDHDNPTLKNQIRNHEILRSDELHLPAFNSGVLLLDLHMLRHSHPFPKFIEKSKLVDPYFEDQGVLNLVFRGKWKALPDRWNRQIHISDQFTTYRPHPDSIWHFIGERKPWHFDPNCSRGIIANFHRDLIHCQWPLRTSLNLKPTPPAWRDLSKKIGSDLLRYYRKLYPVDDISSAAMNPSINIAIAADESYVEGLVGTLVGIAANAPLSTFQTYILDCGISDASWHELDKNIFSRSRNIRLWRMPINDAKLQRFVPSTRSRGLNNATYARFLLPELLPEIERIIYLDCDLVIDTDLSALFMTPLGGAIAGAVVDDHLPSLSQNIPPDMLSPDERDLPAFNAGVMLLDLSLMRQAELLEPIIEKIPQMQSSLQSQAVLNFIFQRKWKALPQRWNRQRFVTENFSIHREYPDSVWHFIGKMKPWHFAHNHRRGLVSDFHQNIDASDWSRHREGNSQLLSPVWKENLKTLRATALRCFRRFTAPKSSS